MVNALFDEEQIAWCILFSELEGGHFNFDTMRWDPRT